MHALALHEDVIVIVSGVWQTTATAVRAGEEGFLIDSPVLVEEIEALPRLLEQASFPVSGLLATHGDWDHLLGRIAFPDSALGVAESTAKRLTENPGEAQRELRDFDDRFYVAGRRPLALGQIQGLPVPGKLSLGSGNEVEIEVHPAAGHTGDGAAFWLGFAKVLVCGDYLSSVEIPAWDAAAGGSAEAYLETLKLLAPLVEQADAVVPGHGEPQLGNKSDRILAEDLAYVEAMLASGDAPLPPKRRSAEQKRRHAENVVALGA